MPSFCHRWTLPRRSPTPPDSFDRSVPQLARKSCSLREPVLHALKARAAALSSAVLFQMDAFWTAKAEGTGLIVRLYCADTKCYLRVNKNGRLFADVPQEDSSKLTDETEFLLHRVRVALHCHT